MIRRLCLLLMLFAHPSFFMLTSASIEPISVLPHRDIVLIIDRSGSMRNNDPLQLSLAAAKLFLDLSDVGDRIGIIVMSDQEHTRPLTRRMVRITEQMDVIDLKVLIDSLRAEPMGEETHMGTALMQASALLDAIATDAQGPNQSQFVVLLSDGLPTGEGQDQTGGVHAQRVNATTAWEAMIIGDPCINHRV